MVAFSDVVGQQHVSSPDVYTDLRPVEGLGVLVQQLRGPVSHVLLESELLTDCITDEIEVLPRLKILRDDRVLLGQLLKSGVVGGEVLLGHLLETLVRLVLHVGDVEDVLQSGGGLVEGVHPVHMGDAQQRGVLEHTVAQLARHGDGDTVNCLPWENDPRGDVGQVPKTSPCLVSSVTLPFNFNSVVAVFPLLP